MYIRQNEGPSLVPWNTLVFISRHVNTLVFQPTYPWFSANQCNRESLILALSNLTIRPLCSTDVTKHSYNFFTQIKSLTNWDYLSAIALQLHILQILSRNMSQTTKWNLQMTRCSKRSVLMLLYSVQELRICQKNYQSNVIIINSKLFLMLQIRNNLFKLVSDSITKLAVLVNCTPCYPLFISHCLYIYLDVYLLYPVTQ